MIACGDGIIGVCLLKKQIIENSFTNPVFQHHRSREKTMTHWLQLRLNKKTISSFFFFFLASAISCTLLFSNKLHDAVEKGKINVVKELLQQPEIDINDIYNGKKK